MSMPPALRRAMLAAHIICSVGWLGAAAAYLALGVAAQVSMEPQVIRAAWIAMELSGWFVIVPLACLAFLTGLVLSLGTPWGLFKHYWVIIAVVLTTLSLAVLLLHMPSVSTLARLARTADDAAASRLGGDVLHPALGLLVLIVITVLNVHKPRGLTPYGQHKQTKEPKGSTRNRAAAPNRRPEIRHRGPRRWVCSADADFPAAENRVGARRLCRRQACARARPGRSRE
jgi:uncharacterized membrane protein